MQTRVRRAIARSSRRDVIVTCPARNFVTLKIVTRSGVTGLGDATLNGRELAVASYLKDHVVPNLIGRDAGRIEDTWQFFYRGAYWRRGPVTMTAIAAVDVALWDILGKMAGLPLYQLLGGRSREGALVYGHANGTRHRRGSAEVGRYIEQGYKAVRAQSGVPGIKKAYGISNRQECRTSPRRASCRSRPCGPRRNISTFVPQAVRALAHRSRQRSRAAARRASPPHADRSGAPRRDRSSPTGCSGWRTRRPRRTREPSS